MSENKNENIQEHVVQHVGVDVGGFGEPEMTAGHQVTHVGVDLAQMARKAAKALKADGQVQERKQAVDGPGSLDGPFHVMVERHGYKRYTAETINELPRGLGRIRAVGEDADDAVRMVRIHFIDRLQSAEVETDRMKAAKIAAMARFPVMDILDRERLIILPQGPEMGSEAVIQELAHGGTHG